MISVASSAPVLSVAARTDPGLKRQQNEDWLLAADPCFLVADGMGGYEAGDEAARTAIAAFSEEFTTPGPASLERIEAAIDRARVDVERVAARTARGAGCTLTGIVRIEHEGVPTWYVLNIGDSRVYLLRGNVLEQLTSDHSLRSELRAAGSADAEVTPRNVITRALGSRDSRHDAWLLPVETGTRLLICSDGLTAEVDDDEIRAVLSAGGTPDAVSDKLVNRALEEGGRDNITLIVADVISGGIVSEGTTPEDDATIDHTRPRRR